jgi:beta-glucosidase
MDACNHWDLNQFCADLEIARSLGINAYRMSIEWSRIYPAQGELNYVALNKYASMLQLIHAAGMKTMVTLHHFTSPLWFAEQGGWESGPLDAFYAYVTVIAHALEDLADFWITINEPLLMIRLGWIAGLFPPGKKHKIFRAMRVARRMIQAHNEAYTILKEHTAAPIGLAYNFAHYSSARKNILDWLAVKYEDYALNHWFIGRTLCDFVGCNYYFHEKLRVGWFPPRVQSTLQGQTADGFYRVLCALGRYGKPIIVTENGIDDKTDAMRGPYITAHVAAMRRAMQDGVDIQGYLYWCLLDTPEWVDGYQKHFGLVAVDRATGERTVRPSALTYKAIITAGHAPI